MVEIFKTWLFNHTTAIVSSQWTGNSAIGITCLPDTIKTQGQGAELILLELFITKYYNSIANCLKAHNIIILHEWKCN